MIVLDANVLIAFLDSDDVHHARARSLVEAHVEGGFAVSVLTAAEAIVHPARAGRGAEGMAVLDRLPLMLVPFTEQDIQGVAQVRADRRIRMPDAVVLHTALASGAVLATFDATLAGAAREAGVEVVGEGPTRFAPVEGAVSTEELGRDVRDED